MADSTVTTKDELEKLIRQVVKEELEQIPLNKVQGLAGQLATIDQRLKKGGL